MDINNAVIDELRTMFRAGATPSRLILHIVARHPNGGNWHGLIQDYFREGFGVQIVRGLRPGEQYQDIDLRYAYLNEDVLHEMMQNQPAWDGERDASVHPSWLDSLLAKSTAGRIQELEHSQSPALLESWDTLTDKDRATIIRMAANLHTRIEMCHILARLVERLQQQILALERK